jgi:hypothetical protein
MRLLGADGGRPARRRTSTVLAVLSATTLLSGWLGAYALTAWPYVI